MFFENDNSSGVSGDLSSASRVAALMEGSFGMGASLTSANGTRQNAGGGPANAVSISLRENREAIEKNLAHLYDDVAGLLEEHREKVLELAAVLEQRKNISGDEVAEIMGSTPGSRTMREPTGWQAVSDTVAGDRQREALLRSGREKVDAAESEPAGEDTPTPVDPIEREQLKSLCDFNCTRFVPRNQIQTPQPGSPARPMVQLSAKGELKLGSVRSCRSRSRPPRTRM